MKNTIDNKGVPINVTLTERVVAQVYCYDALSAVTEFVTTSPLWMTKTSVAPVLGTTDQYYITLTWTPVDDQYGPQVTNIFSKKSSIELNFIGKIVVV